MKKKNLLLLLTLFAAVLSTVSCTKDRQRKDEVVFASNIQKITQVTRVTGNTWDATDSIGIYMVEKENIEIIERAENIPYVTNLGGATGSFIPKSKTIFFPDNDQEVRFMAYYPYNSGVVDALYKVDVSDQTNQSKIDILQSFDVDKTYSKVTKREKVVLEFDHMLTKVIINVREGKGLEKTDLDNLGISFTGLSREVDFDLWGAAFSNYSNVGDIVPKERTEVADGYYLGYEAILIPSLNVLDAYMVFDLNNGGEGVASDKFRWRLDATLARSSKYTYNVTINRTGITVDATINDWINLDDENIIAE